MNALFGLVLLISSHCAERQTVLNNLEERYSEIVVSSAINYDGTFVETTVNKETGTWSFLMSAPGRLTCIVASGTGWREKKEIPGDEDA